MRTGLLCVPSSCDRRWRDISAASIAAGVVTSAALCNSANSSRVTWAHALRMQPLSTPLTSKLRSYRRTTQPSSGPSGSRKSCFLWMLSFSSQPSLWRNVLRLAHCFRASDGTFLDCCDALLFCRRLCRAHKSPALHVAATAPTSLALFGQARCLSGHALHQQFAYNVVIAVMRREFIKN